MGDRVVITGAAGFIGSALVARHVAEGAVVHALVRHGAGIERLPKGVAIHPVDLGNHDALRGVLAETAPTIIYHLATSTGRATAPSAQSGVEAAGSDVANLLGLLSVAAALPHPPRSFVRTGTLAEYGDGPTPAREEQREHPKNGYTGAMVAGAHLVSALQSRLPFHARTARLGLTYGPKQSPTYLIPLLIERCLAAEPSLVRTPEQRRDLIFVDDVVSGLIALARSDRPDAGVVNLATGEAPTMREAAWLVARCCGADPGLIRFGDEMPADVPPVVCGDPSRARAILGWQATCSLEEGLRRTVHALRYERAAA